MMHSDGDQVPAPSVACASSTDAQNEQQVVSPPLAVDAGEPLETVLVDESSGGGGFAARAAQLVASGSNSVHASRGKRSRSPEGGLGNAAVVMGQAQQPEVQQFQPPEYVQQQVQYVVVPPEQLLSVQTGSNPQQQQQIYALAPAAVLNGGGSGELSIAQQAMMTEAQQHHIVAPHLTHDPTMTARLAPPLPHHEMLIAEQMQHREAPQQLGGDVQSGGRPEDTQLLLAAGCQFVEAQISRGTAEPKWASMENTTELFMGQITHHVNYRELGKALQNVVRADEPILAATRSVNGTPCCTYITIKSQYVDFFMGMSEKILCDPNGLWVPQSAEGDAAIQQVSRNRQLQGARGIPQRPMPFDRVRNPPKNVADRVLAQQEKVKKEFEAEKKRREEKSGGGSVKADGRDRHRSRDRDGRRSSRSTSRDRRRRDSSRERRPRRDSSRDKEKKKKSSRHHRSSRSRSRSPSKERRHRRHRSSSRSPRRDTSRDRRRRRDRRSRSRSDSRSHRRHRRRSSRDRSRDDRKKRSRKSRSRSPVERSHKDDAFHRAALANTGFAGHPAVIPQQPQQQQQHSSNGSDNDEDSRKMRQAGIEYIPLSTLRRGDINQAKLSSKNGVPQCKLFLARLARSCTAAGLCDFLRVAVGSKEPVVSFMKYLGSTAFIEVDPNHGPALKKLDQRVFSDPEGFWVARGADQGFVLTEVSQVRQAKNKQRVMHKAMVVDIATDKPGFGPGERAGGGGSGGGGGRY